MAGIHARCIMGSGRRLGWMPSLIYNFKFILSSKGQIRSNINIFRICTKLLIEISLIWFLTLCWYDKHNMLLTDYLWPCTQMYSKAKRQSVYFEYTNFFCTPNLNGAYILFQTTFFFLKVSKPRQLLRKQN